MGASGGKTPAGAPTFEADGETETMILAIDPSSKRCGYAVLRDLSQGGLVDGGLLVPRPTDLPVLDRVRQFGVDLREILEEFPPASLDAIVFEVSLSAHGHARDRGASAFLGVYGLAVGYLLHAVEALANNLELVQTVDATVWTKKIPKQKRTKVVADYYGGTYDGRGDPGGDVADAIGVGRWWMLEHRVAALGGRGIRAGAK